MALDPEDEQSRAEGAGPVLLLVEKDLRADRLTSRQREVLAGVAAGLTDVEIAEQLCVAPATVGKHLEAIFERLDVLDLGSRFLSAL